MSRSDDRISPLTSCYPYCCCCCFSACPACGVWTVVDDDAGCMAGGRVEDVSRSIVVADVPVWSALLWCTCAG